MTKSLRVVSLMAVLFAISWLSGCTRVGAGHVGVEINLAGSQRGASEIPIRTGYVFYNPFTTDIVEYPTYVQTATWTAKEHEGRDTDDSITFNSKEGLSINADISLSYQLDATKVPDFYVKFRSDDLNNFTHGYLRNVARDAFSEVSSTYSVEDLYGAKKGEYLATVRSRLQAEVAPLGVQIQQLGFIEAPRVPESYLTAMNNKVTAIQQAEQAKNELARTQAEANKVVAEAEGTAKAQIARASGEAEANRVINASITPNILEMRRLNNQHDLIWRWNGERPNIEVNGAGGNSLLLNVPAGK